MKQSSISNVLFRGTQAQAREQIKKISQTQWLCVVNFLYFARAMKFDVYKDNYHPELVSGSKHWNKFSITKSDYKTALLHSDILCIDGIAMQVFDRVWQFFFGWKRSWTENLNGTDFLPYILEHTKDKKIGIIMSTVYDPNINKWPEWMDKWLKKLQHLYPHVEIIFKYQSLFQNRGEEFPIEECISIIKDKKNNYDHILFLNGIWWPKQETRTEQHKHLFQDTKIIIMNNGATLDYYSGFETRAPKRVVKMRIGETLWRITTQPKKNLKKFLAMFKIIEYRWYLIKQYITKVTKSQ